MIAFDVLVNGKPLYTIGAGDFGLLSANVQFERIQTKSGRIHERTFVAGKALHGIDTTHSDWPEGMLKVGDEVTVRVVETGSYDPPVTRTTLEGIKQRQDLNPD